MLDGGLALLLAVWVLALVGLARSWRALALALGAGFLVLAGRLAGLGDPGALTWMGSALLAAVTLMVLVRRRPSRTGDPSPPTTCPACKETSS